MKLKMITVAMLLALSMDLAARDLAQMKNYRELSNLVYANLPANEQEQLLRLAVSSGLPAQSSAARSAISKHFKGINWNQLVNIYNNQGFNGVKAHLGITASTPSKASGPIILTTPTKIPTPPPLLPRPKTQPQAQNVMPEAEQQKIMQELNQKIQGLDDLIKQHWNDMSQLEKVLDPLAELYRTIQEKENAGLSDNNVTQLSAKADALSSKISDRVHELDAANKQKYGEIKAIEHRFNTLHMTKGVFQGAKLKDLDADMQTLESIITDINSSTVLNAQDKSDLIVRATEKKDKIIAFIQARIERELQSLTTQVNDALRKAVNTQYLQYLLNEVDGKLDELGQMKQEYVSPTDKSVLEQKYNALLDKIKNKTKELQKEKENDKVKSQQIAAIVGISAQDEQADESERRWQKVQEEMKFWEDAVANRIAENPTDKQLNELKKQLENWKNEFHSDKTHTSPSDKGTNRSAFDQIFNKINQQIDEAIKKIKA